MTTCLGEPICGFIDPPNAAFNVYPISLARTQRYARDNCALSAVGSGDTFSLPGNQTQCDQMWGAHVETYELVLSEVDAALSSPADRLLQSTAQEILDRVVYVGLDVIQDVAGDFHCPSGVNVWMHRVNDAVGYDTHITFNGSSNNVSKYVRH